MGIAILLILFVGAMLLLLHFVFVPTPKVVSKAVEEPQRVVYVPVQVPIYIQPIVEDEKVDDEPYFKEISPATQKIIDAQMDRFLERCPDIPFFQEHPHYLEAYLSRVDISELGLTVQEDEDDEPK